MKRTAWWMSLGLALLTSGRLYAGAPGLEHLMKMPGLREGVRLHSLSSRGRGRDCQRAIATRFAIRRARDCRRSRRDGFSRGRALSALEAAAAVEPCRGLAARFAAHA